MERLLMCGVAQRSGPHYAGPEPLPGTAAAGSTPRELLNQARSSAQLTFDAVRRAREKVFLPAPELNDFLGHLEGEARRLHEAITHLLEGREDAYQHIKADLIF